MVKKRNNQINSVTPDFVNTQASFKDALISSLVLDSVSNALKSPGEKINIKL